MLSRGQIFLRRRTPVTKQERHPTSESAPHQLSIDDHPTRCSFNSTIDNSHSTIVLCPQPGQHSIEESRPRIIRCNRAINVPLFWFSSGADNEILGSLSSLVFRRFPPIQSNVRGKLSAVPSNDKSISLGSPADRGCPFVLTVSGPSECVSSSFRHGFDTLSLSRLCLLSSFSPKRQRIRRFCACTRVKYYAIS